MNRTDLTTELTAALGDASSKLSSDLDRLLDTAVRDLMRVAPRTVRGSFTVVADQDAYTAPGDIERILMTIWGKAELCGRIKPWDDNWPGKLPDLSLEDGQLYLTPAPTAFQINVLGSDYEYRYVAAYTLGDTEEATNIPERLHNALIVRAVAEGMFTLAHSGINKPVALGGSGNGLSMPKNGHPAALAADLMALFKEMAA